MKNLLIFSTLIFFNLVFSQVRNDTILVKKEVKRNQLCNKINDINQISISHDEEGMYGLDRTKQRVNKRNIYIDSLNNYTEGKLPAFILNECFDMRGDLWEGIHEYPTLRFNMLQKVHNIFALKKIIKSKNERLKDKCTSTSAKNIPFIDKSFYDLIVERYFELKKER